METTQLINNKEKLKKQNKTKKKQERENTQKAKKINGRNPDGKRERPLTEKQRLKKGKKQRKGEFE